jgi:hypothetical protein
VCREQALKSVGERNTHGECRCGGLRGPARAREVTPRGGVKRQALYGIDGGDLRFGCAALCLLVLRAAQANY